MRLRFEREVACSPKAAFSLVSDPDHMNLWSTAPIRSVSVGDGGHPGGVGAMRVVRVPGRRPMRLVEVIEESEPPHRFGYRVVSGAPVRDHRGTVTLEPSGRGTHLVWDVEIEFPYPLMGRIARRRLEPEVERSLDRLVEVAPSIGNAELPPDRHLDETKALPGLYDAAEAILAEQRDLADELEAARDPRWWFTRVYEHVTELQVASCRAARFGHPAWVLRLVPDFHRYYADNLLRKLHRRSGPVEHHWRHAFDAMARPAAWKNGRFQGMGRAVYQGMRAHIEEDLPRALAGVYLRSYEGRCDYARFRADYLRMGPIFREAGDRMMGELRPWEVPVRTHLVGALAAPETRDAMMARSFDDMPRGRREAGERRRRRRRRGDQPGIE